MDLLIGASASVGFISSALSQDASPAIELSWTSTMRSKPMFLKIYRDGRVLWPNRTTALLGKLSPDEVARLLSDIEGTGFFSLDQETINRSIALASGRSYRRRATNQIYPPGDTIIDAATSTVTVRSAQKTNQVALFAVGQYAATYPQISELKVFQKTVFLIHAAATGVTNATTKSFSE